MNLWLVIIVIGVFTYATRLSFIALVGTQTFPPLLQRALRFVPVTVLPAIIAQELVFYDAAGGLSLHNPRLLAGLIAAAVAWRTRNVLLTIAVGMGALVLLTMLPGM